MVKVFLSFTATLMAVRDGEVSDKDLEGGLFCLDRSRPYLFGKEVPREVHGVFARNLGRGDEVFSRFRKAVVKAEKAGRVAWPADGEPRREAVSKLLSANGARPLNPNLPPVHALKFIATAIEGANRNSRVRIEPIY